MTGEVVPLYAAIAGYACRKLARDLEQLNLVPRKPPQGARIVAWENRVDNTLQVEFRDADDALIRRYAVPMQIWRGYLLERDDEILRNLT